MAKKTLAASSGLPMRLVARLRTTAPASPIDRLIKAAVVDSPDNKILIFYFYEISLDQAEIIRELKNN